MVKNRVPNQLWVEVVNTSAYILNRCWTKSNNMIIPKELFSGVKLDVHHLRMFGLKIYVHIFKEGRMKLEPIAFEGIFVGYDDYSKTYRCYDPKKQKIVISKDVKFDELSIPSIESVVPNLLPFNNINSEPLDVQNLEKVGLTRRISNNQKPGNTTILATKKNGR
jgi:hypothetical protein